MNKRLTRSNENKIIGGICGGLGEYFSNDPILFRILFTILLFCGGAGFLLYLLFWLVMPSRAKYLSNDDFAHSEPDADETNLEATTSTRRPITIGVLLILLGIMFLVENFVSWISWEQLWPMALILIGIAMIIGYFNHHPKK